MDEDLKRRIIENTFVYQLRDGFVVDREAFAALCDDLQALRMPGTVPP